MDSNNLYMSNYYKIHERVIILQLKCRADSEIQYYSQRTGSIQGIKKLNNHLIIYLIEFLNHNRIWVMVPEIEKHK